MSDDIKVLAKPRTSKGTTEARRMRRAGWVPAVVYADGKIGSMIQLNEHTFHQLLRHHASEHLIVDLEVEGSKPQKVLLKEVQHNAVTGGIVHIDFHQLSLSKKFKVGIQVELVGEPVGVSQGGGLLEHLMREVEVECLPTDLIEQLEVDVSTMAIGDVMTAGDIQLDVSKYELVTDPSVAIASVSAPRVAEAATTEEGEEAASAEPEVLSEKALKEGEGEAAAEDKK